MKKLLAGTAAVLAAVLFLSCPTVAVSAQKALLLDAASGEVLYEKRADEKSLIASTTKIMTALLVCENCNMLDIVNIPSEAVGIDGSSVYLREGEKWTVQELLYATMLCSGNDAATALAIHCSGSVAQFVREMNEKAKALGLKNTHFSNPHGLDAAEHYSTARDLAVLARYAMQNILFAQTVSTRSVRVGERVLSNHNKLLWRVEGTEGVKTGYTRAAGRILVSSCRRDGRRLIAVTIDDGNDWADHASLYVRGFSALQTQCIVRAGDIVGTLAVFGGERETVLLVASEDFSFPLRKNEEPTLRLSRKMAFAPLSEGASAGVAYVLLSGNVIGKIQVEYAETVEFPPQEGKKSIRKRLFGD